MDPAALSTGPAIGMLDVAIAFARERLQFGRPIGEYQFAPAMPGQCRFGIEATYELIRETVRKRDRRQAGAFNPS